MKNVEEVVSQHRQLYELSCIPSGVEMILKILGRADMSYYDLQKEWGNRDDGSFALFHRRELFGVGFRHRFSGIDRGPDFPVDELFQTVSDELSNGRYVLISLSAPSGWHMYVIIEETKGEFLSISKRGPNTLENLYEGHTMEIVRQMGGTDILTYEMTHPTRERRENVGLQ